jgi:hypothetical protein
MAYKPKRGRCKGCGHWLFEYDHTGITRTRKGVMKREYRKHSGEFVDELLSFYADTAVIDAATVSAWPRTEAAPVSPPTPLDRIEVGCTCGRWFTFTMRK